MRQICTSTIRLFSSSVSLPLQGHELLFVEPAVLRSRSTFAVSSLQMGNLRRPARHYQPLLDSNDSHLEHLLWAMPALHQR